MGLFESILNIFQTKEEESSGDLIARNEDIIKKHLNLITDSNQRYYADNKIIECVRDIAIRENKNNLVPKDGEWLISWKTRTIPLSKEWERLLSYLEENFRGRITLMNNKKAEEETRAEKIKLEKRIKDILENNKNTIDKFFDIAERKVSVIDDYGDENWDALPEEIKTCLTKVAKSEGDDNEDFKDWINGKRSWGIPEEYEKIKEKLENDFKEYHKNHKGDYKDDLNGLSGVEFETHIAHILKEKGFDVVGTPTTGDQGADLIAKKDGKTIIIQAKRYQGAVGNKAIQEVMGAVSFYEGDEGWVITNSTFTTSAKALAQKGNIKLIDGNSLKKQEIFKNK